MTRSSIRLLFGVSLFWVPLSMLFDGVTTILLPERISALASDRYQATIVGVVSFTALLVAMLVQPLAGAWSDRMRPRRGRLTTLAAGLVLTIVWLALLGSADSAWLVGIAVILVMASASVAQAGQQALIPDLVSLGSRGIASGLKGLADLLGAMLGFGLLGVLVASGSISQAAMAIGVVWVAAFVLLRLALREPRKGVRLSLRSPLRFRLADHPDFARLVASRFLFLFGIYAVGRFFLFLVARRLGIEERDAADEAGILLGGLALATALASPLAGWICDRVGRVPVTRFGAAVATAGVLFLIPAPSLPLLAVGGLLMAVGSATFATANWAMTADVVPADEAGLFMGIANFGTAGAAALAGLAGPVIDLVGFISVEAGYVTLLLIAAAATALSMHFIPQETAKQRASVGMGLELITEKGKGQ